MTPDPVLHVTPVTLTGRVVRLDPLNLAQVPDLTVAGRDEDIWRYMPYPNMQTEAQMHAWVADLLHRQTLGGDLPFAVYHLVDQKYVGATRYMDIQAANLGLEIGGTWYGPAYQRTAVNTECKYLLLRHAFEVLGCNRVQLKTDLRNERSQKAIERIGAVREGVLRQHTLMPDGYRRSTVVYSIIDTEWPDVKARLEARMTPR